MIRGAPGWNGGVPRYGGYKPTQTAGTVAGACGAAPSCGGKQCAMNDCALLPSMRLSWGRASLVRSLALAALTLLASSRAEAANLQGGVSIGAGVDDNVFLLADRVEPLSGSCRTDQNGLLGGNFNFGIGGEQADVVPRDWQAHAVANAFEMINKCNSSLNSANIAVNSQIVSPQIGPISLKLNGSIQHRRSSFGELYGYYGNIQTTIQTSSEVRFEIWDGISLLVRPQFLDSSNSLAALSSLNYRQWGGEIGLGYFSPIGNAIALTVGREKASGKESDLISVQGQLLDFRTDLVDDLIALTVHYVPSPIFQISSRIAYAKRVDHGPIPADFKGLVGDFTLTYAPREGMSLKLRAARQLSSQSYLFINGQKTDIVAGEANGLIGRRIALKLSATYTNQNLGQSLNHNIGLNSASGNGSGSNNRLLWFSGQVSRDIADRSSLSLIARHDVRFGGGFYQPYTENALRLIFTYGFGGVACSMFTC